jgi:WD40 repeat protein
MVHDRQARTKKDRPMRRTDHALLVGWAALLIIVPGLSGCGGGGGMGGAVVPVMNNTLKGPDDKGHTLPAYGVAYSPDGKFVVTTSHDQTAKIWDATSGQVLATLNGHNNSVKGVAVSPDGKTIFTGGCDQAVKLWDMATRKEVAALRGLNDPGGYLALSPDGKTLATSGLGNAVQLWDVASRKPTRTLNGHIKPVLALAFSPDGKTLASASQDFMVRLWDLAGSREPIVLQGHADVVYCVAFSPDGKTLASGSADGTVRFWTVATGAALQTRIANQREESNNQSDVTSLAFSPDGKSVAVSFTHLRQPISVPGVTVFYDVESWEQKGGLIGQLQAIWGLTYSPSGDRIATASGDGSIRIWDPATKLTTVNLRGFFKAPPPGWTNLMTHAGQVRAVVLTHDDKTIISGGDDNSIRMFDVNTTEDTVVIDNVGYAVHSLALSPDGKTLAAGGDGNRVTFWDPADGRALGELSTQSVRTTCLAYSPDGKILAYGGHDGAVVLWDVAAKKALASLTRHTNPVTSLCFSPDGKVLATASEDQTVKIWDVASHAMIASLDEHTDAIFSLAFSPDGLSVASGSRDATVIIWDWKAEAPRHTLKGSRGGIFAMAYSPDGKTLITGDGIGTLKRWDAVHGRLVSSHDRAHFFAALSLAFASDGQSIYSGSIDRQVKRWNLESDFPRTRFIGHSERITAIAFSPDGKLVATGGTFDFVAKLWEAETGQELGTLDGHSGWITSIAFSPDGKVLATGSAGYRGNQPPPAGSTPPGEVKLWDVATCKELPPLAGDTSQTMAMAFSPDGKTLLTGAVHETATLWDFADRKPRRIQRIEGSSVNAVAFARDGKTFWTGDNHGQISAWDTESGDLRGHLESHTSNISTMALSADGKILASAGLDRGIRLWDTATGKLQGILKGMKKAVHSLGFSPDGALIAAAGWQESTVRVWDVKSNTLRWTLPMPAAPDRVGDTFERVAFSPDGKQLFTTAYRAILTWDAPPAGRQFMPYQPPRSQALARLGEHADAVRILRFAPDGRTLISWADDQVVKLWDVAQRHERATIGGGSDRMYSVDVSPDGTTLATGSSPSKTADVRLWDLATGQARGPSAKLPPWTADLQYLPDGKTLVACDGDGGVHFLDAKSLETASTSATPTIMGRALKIASDGKCLAVISADGKAELWDPDKRTIRAAVAFSDQPLYMVRFTATFSPDGKTFASGAMKYTGSDRGRMISAGILKLFDPSDGREVAMLLGQGGAIRALAFSPDGKTLASGTDTGSLLLWDLTTRTQKFPLTGHNGSVNRIAFSPDGKTLASGGQDGLLRLWDPSSGRPLTTLSGHEDSIESLVFSPDGAFIATGSGDNSVMLWDAKSIGR